jgi:hypothetical protein
MTFRYFLHQRSDWPLTGACNTEPFGPDGDGNYLATLDASGPFAALYGLGLPELTVEEARAWVARLATPEEPDGE